MVRALAGFDARPLLSSPPTALNFETPHATDDLLLTGGENSLSRVFIQAKRGLNFSALEDSELASVFQQFVAQYAAAARSDSTRDPGATPPHSRETLILATDPSSSPALRSAASWTRNDHAACACSGSESVRFPANGTAAERRRGGNLQRRKATHRPGVAAVGSR
jgi:hypothetical protein